MLSCALLFSSVNGFAPPVALPGTGLAASRHLDVVMKDINVRTIPVKNQWVNFEAAANIPPGTIGSGYQYGLEIAIANAGGSYFALANKLPPTGQPATFGSIEKFNGKTVIVEPVSGSCFDLKTGKCIEEAWCPSLVGRILLNKLVRPTNVQAFQCRKQGSNIQVLIDVNAKAKFEAQYWRGVLDAQGKVDGGYY